MRAADSARRLLAVSLLCLFGLFSVGCRAASTTEISEAATTEPAPAQPVERTLEETLEQVRRSTVRVTAHDVEVASGDRIEVTASGFVIDEQGYMITNMHVVSGGQRFSVAVPDRDDLATATVVGMAECSDLALLKIEGDGFAYLGFRERPVNPGLPVWAAGYPSTSTLANGQRDYTLTTGIVNTTTGSGETATASLESVVEHSAKGRLGDSGGPVVDDQADVVGVTFFGSDVDDVNLAIDGPHASTVAERLRSGSIESLGIEGNAEDAGGESWVTALTVSPGTEAERAGIMPGDQIVRLGGSTVGGDSRMRDYCAIVRNRAAGEPLAVEVVRPSTGETLAGEFGGASLEVISTAGSTGSDVAGSDASVQVATDDSEQLSVELPVTWQIDGQPADSVDAGVYASPDLDNFYRGLASGDFVEPGMALEVRSAPGVDLDAEIDAWVGPEQLGEQCSASFRQEWVKADGSLTGEQLIFDGCGPAATTVVFIVAIAADGETVVRVAGFSVDEPSAQAIETVLRTFRISLSG